MDELEKILLTQHLPEKARHDTRFEVFKAIKIQVVAYNVVTPCRDVAGYTAI
jgi:hypothetical protein